MTHQGGAVLPPAFERRHLILMTWWFALWVLRTAAWLRDDDRVSLFPALTASPDAVEGIQGWSPGDREEQQQLEVEEAGLCMATACCCGLTRHFLRGGRCLVAASGGPLDRTRICGWLASGMLVVWDAPIKFGVSSGGGDFDTNRLHLRLQSAPQLNGWHQGSVISYAAANELPSSLSVYINCVDYRFTGQSTLLPSPISALATDVFLPGKPCSQMRLVYYFALVVSNGGAGVLGPLPVR